LLRWPVPACVMSASVLQCALAPFGRAVLGGQLGLRWFSFSFFSRAVVSILWLLLDLSGGEQGPASSALPPPLRESPLHVVCGEAEKLVMEPTHHQLLLRLAVGVALQRAHAALQSAVLRLDVSKVGRDEAVEAWSDVQHRKSLPACCVVSKREERSDDVVLAHVAHTLKLDAQLRPHLGLGLPRSPAKLFGREG
jgi:hypothetical protein